MDCCCSTAPLPRSLRVNASGEPVGCAQASNASLVLFFTSSVMRVCLASTTTSCSTTSGSDSSGSWSLKLWAWALHAMASADSAAKRRKEDVRRMGGTVEGRKGEWSVDRAPRWPPVAPDSARATAARRHRPNSTRQQFVACCPSTLPSRPPAAVTWPPGAPHTPRAAREHPARPCTPPACAGQTSGEALPVRMPVAYPGAAVVRTPRRCPQRPCRRQCTWSRTRAWRHGACLR